MKAAVSLPAPIFEEAEALAKRLQLSRSELYLKALKAYLKRHNQAQTLKQINKVYAEEDFKPDPAMSKMQLMSFDKTLLTERIGSLPTYLQKEIDEGLRTILYL